MNIFLDTNTLLDWLLDRQDTFAYEATVIIDAADKGKIGAYVSAGSLYTVAYLLEKNGRKGDDLRRAIRKVLGILKIIEAGSTFNSCSISSNYPYRNASSNPSRYVPASGIGARAGT